MIVLLVHACSLPMEAAGVMKTGLTARKVVKPAAHNPLLKVHNFSLLCY